ncbi:MAG: cyclase family protein [Clostridia bacterium]|nr:cyclase family protein [Clostridia bacterium]
MKIYDISQEVFSSDVFPGDPVPKKEMISQIENGDVCNLSKLSMCAHNGTHIDAPFHFISDGKTVDKMGLEAFVGMAYVAEHQGVVSYSDAENIIKKAREKSEESAKRILVKGEVEVSLEATEAFVKAGILLLGNEPQTVGPKDSPMAVHLALLGAGVALLEGIRLKNVAEGVYFLSSAPLNLGGGDGAPCRAVLIDIK